MRQKGGKDSGGGGAVGTEKRCQDTSSDTRATRATSAHLRKIHMVGLLSRNRSGFAPSLAVSYVHALLQSKGKEWRQMGEDPFKSAPGFQWGIRIGDSGKEEGSGQGRGGLVLQP